MRKMHGGGREIHTLIGVLPEILVRFSILNHGWIEYSKGINISFNRLCPDLGSLPKSVVKRVCTTQFG